MYAYVISKLIFQDVIKEVSDYGVVYRVWYKFDNGKKK